MSASTAHRRILEVLAAVDGIPEALLLARGFEANDIAALVEAGLATVETRNVIAGGVRVNVTRIRITPEGTAAIAR